MHNNIYEQYNIRMLGAVCLYSTEKLKRHDTSFADNSRTWNDFNKPKKFIPVNSIRVNY